MLENAPLSFKLQSRSAGDAYLLCVLLAVCMLILTTLAAPAETLKGRVSVEEEMLRIRRPPAAPPQATLNSQGPATRIARPAGGFNPLAGRPTVDTTAFAPPLAGRAQDDDFKLGVVKADEFKAPPAKNFDLGAERGSRELLLAWERWHKQLSQAIYKRWSDRARTPGEATVRVTVTRDRTIRAQILRCTGGFDFEEGLRDAVEGLNGNPGLTFPTKSLRKYVTFEGDYIASPNVRPGYSWVKNDVEKIREDW